MYNSALLLPPAGMLVMLFAISILPGPVFLMWFLSLSSSFRLGMGSFKSASHVLMGVWPIVHILFKNGMSTLGASYVDS